MCLFFLDQPAESGALVPLSEETAKHLVSVLRYKEGDALQLTDGKGNLYNAIIENCGKKKCEVKLLDRNSIEPPRRNITIAISVLKNASRFEWFLEKATEVGINHIIPILCERTERQHFRYERMQTIVVSAMLQSKQYRLPVLEEPVSYHSLFERNDVIHASQKFIAHCEDDAKTCLPDAVNPSMQSQVILIGPEGDFSHEEIILAESHHFLPVSLGDNRLRAETAGIVAAVMLRLCEG
jgi:16S rRNA (uracil1498-N3)-methyltransferase